MGVFTYNDFINAHEIWRMIVKAKNNMQAAAKDTDKVKFPFGKFMAWKSRDVSIAGISVIVTGYLAIFCTDSLGMKPAVVGNVILLSKMIDIVMNFLTGYMVDNTNTKLGKGRPYEICIIGSWLATVLLFFCPASFSMTAKTIWLFVMYTLIFSIFNSFLTAAQNPYMIRAFVDKTVISKVASFGGMVTMLGSLIVSITFPVLMARLATSDGGWHALILIYAIPLGLIGILRMIFVREDTSIDAGNTAQKVDVKQIITMLAKNRFIWAYAGISGFYNLTVGLNVSTFYFKYVVGNVGLLGVMSALSMVLLPVMIVFPKLMKKFSVCNLIEMGSAAAMLGCALIFAAKANMILLIAGSVLVAIASLPIAYLGVLIVMELSTYNEWNGLPRMEGSTNIVSNFAARVFNGIGVALQGGVLSLFGYVSGSGTAVTQPAGAIMAIRSLYSLIPMAFYACIIVCALILGRLEKKMPQIEADLKKRQEGNAE